MEGGNDHADDMDVDQQQEGDDTNKQAEHPPAAVAAVTSGDDDENDEEVDEEQIEEYQEMLESLGAHPDKLKINSLSMVAEDFSASAKMAKALYETIRKPLISLSVPKENKLPLVYVVDSLLKNVRGKFIPLIESDAKTWMPVVFEQMSEEQRAKLRKVWDTWRVCKLFSEQNWEDMGICFVEADGVVEAQRSEAEAKARAVGIGRKADGSLDVSSELRRQMQLLLDEAQSEGVDELDKVSLERLAEINPELLAEIKSAAQEIVASGGGGSGGGSGSADKASGGGAKNGRWSPKVASANFTETRPDEIIARAADWDRLKLDHLEKAHKSISNLQLHVRVGCTEQRQYASEEEFQEQMGVLVSASAGARYLTTMLEALKTQEESKDSADADAGKVGGRFTSGAIDKSEFTREGLKKKKPSVIARLYDGGLPFVCASDGRRFATQVELTKHMDVLFKQGQVEKTMEKTEERGWYVWEGEWTGKDKKAASAANGEGPEGASEAEAAAASSVDDTADPDSFTVLADESRDRCLICGINFGMFFDQDEGEWMYKNCREVRVENDETAINESDDVFVHVTCLRGLGSPEFLTMDQVVQVN